MHRHFFIDCGAPSIYNEYSRLANPESGAIMGSSFKDRKNDSDEYIHSDFFIGYLKEYLSFCEKLPKSETLIFSALDVINNPKETYRIWKMFKEKDIPAIPCWHLGSDVSYLERYLHDYKEPYIAIGGMTPNPVTVLLKPLDDLWAEHLTNKNGLPYAKYHGFAMTSFRLMFRYPWYSVDSSAANVIARFGKVWIPNLFKDFKRPIPLRVSYHSEAIKNDRDNIWNSSKPRFSKISEFVESQGFQIGKSSLKTVGENYKLEPKLEYWFNKKEKQVTTILIPGVSNTFDIRWEYNMKFLKIVSDQFPVWPYAFKKIKSKLF